MFGLVADDVTGANATAARVAARAGIAGRVWLAGLTDGNGAPPGGSPAAPAAAAAAAAAGAGAGAGPQPGGPAPALWVIPTHSRSVEPAVARHRVREAVRALGEAGCRFFGKRIDSTLRGNLGAELAGALEALPGHLAVVVAAFPASGRATVGGRLWVHGVPLLETEAARDPITPVTDDDVARLLATQSGLPVTYLPPGPAGYDEALPQRLAALHRAGTRAVVLDAAREEDVEAVAALVARAPVPVLAVDPGPFFAAWVAHLANRHAGTGGPGDGRPSDRPRPASAPRVEPAPRPMTGHPTGTPAAALEATPVAAAEREPQGPPAAAPGGGPWLVVAGSLTRLTDRQLAALTQRWPVPRLSLPLAQLLEDPEGGGRQLLPQVEAALSRWGVAVVETDRHGTAAPAGEAPSCDRAGPDAAAASGSRRGGPATGAQAPVTGTAAQQVARSLAVLAATLVDRLPHLAGLVLTGGDTAAAVAAALEARALRITAELAPLVAAGSLEGGRRPGLAVITKGGLVGDDTLLVRLLEGRVQPGTAAGAAGNGDARGDGDGEVTAPPRGTSRSREAAAPTA
ncbi:four-carbon acid sugar kinase family protein [Thermaerobacter litoralis]